MVTQELLVHRTWDAAQHPAWLVFEVEQQLQIRPEQHKVGVQAQSVGTVLVQQSVRCMP